MAEVGAEVGGSRHLIFILILYDRQDILPVGQNPDNCAKFRFHSSSQAQRDPPPRKNQ